MKENRRRKKKKALILGLIIVLGLIVGGGLFTLTESDAPSEDENGTIDINGNNKKSPDEDEDFSEREREVVIEDAFQPVSNWSSDKGWGEGAYNLETSEGNLIIKSGEKFGHFARKFRDGKFSEVVLEFELPDPESNDIKLQIASTSEDQKELIDGTHFSSKYPVTRNFSTFRPGDSEPELEEGENVIDVSDVDWRRLILFKVLVTRGTPQTESPVLKRMELRT